MKYFITSDIHGFKTILVNSLQAAGFDLANPEHCLVICGDIFDRGPEAVALFQYLQEIPANRLILIKGNHESLYLDLLEKELPASYDFRNGTVDTFCQITNTDIKLLNEYYIANQLFKSGKDFCFEKVELQLKKTWKQVQKKVKKSPITAFLQSSRWLNYFELKTLICVHGFIPVEQPTEHSKADLSQFKLLVTWRTASAKAWEEARWACPWKYFKAGLFQESKTLVVGHWHTADFFTELDNIPTNIFNSTLYSNHGLVALDACTVLSKKINIYIVEE